MKRLSILTSNPYQTVTFTTNSGKNVVMNFRYMPTQQRWFLDLTYGDTFAVNGLAVLCHPNILDKFHNILDFGINVTTDTGLDPTELTCFEDGSCFVCMLDSNEKEQATEYLDGV